MPAGKLVAVIVTYNRRDKLQRTLQHTLANAFYRVVVVDNCSGDGTGEWLDAQEDERLDIIHCASNLGGAGGFETGFRHVVDTLPEADWLVCFDDDAWPEDNVAALFSGLGIGDRTGAVAAAVYLPDGERIAEMNRPSLNPFWHPGRFLRTALRGREGFHITHDSYAGDGLRQVDASSFVGCFVRLSLIREGRIGLPRGELFIYADDIIYTLGIRRAGYRIVFAPGIRFRHDCETLVEQRAVYHPLWKAYYTYRNGLEMYRFTAGLFYPLVLLVKIPRFLLAARHYPQRERPAYLRIARAAIRDGLARDFSRSHTQVLELDTPER